MPDALGMLAGMLEQLVARGWSGAGCVPPLLWPGDRRQIAARALDAAGLDKGAHPLDVARGLGIAVLRTLVRDCGGECTDGLRILYRWHADRDTRRLRMAHGLAHALLVREAWDHSETDALLLTLDFLANPQGPGSRRNPG